MKYTKGIYATIKHEIANRPVFADSEPIKTIDEFVEASKPLYEFGCKVIEIGRKQEKEFIKYILKNSKSF